MPETGLELLNRYALAGDAEAFRELMMLHQNMVYAVCRRVLGNRADAEDAAQTCFLELARRPDLVQGPLAGWLHRAALSRSIDLLRSERARKAREQAAAPQARHTEQREWAEVSHAVDAAIDQLPEELRIAIVRYYLEGQRQEDIARELGVTHSAVSKRLRRGLERLRISLRKGGWIGSVAALGTMLAASAAEAAPPTLVASLGKIAIVGGSVSTTTAAGTAGGTATAAAITATATTGGIGIMKLGLIGLASAAVITASVFVTQVNGQPKPAPPVKERNTKGTTAPTANSQPAKPSSLDDFPATYGPVSCSGVVLDAQGNPIEGAEVVACQPGPYTNFHGMDVRNQFFGSAVVTKTDGRFTFDLHGANGDIYIGARKEGLAVDWSVHRLTVGELRDTLCLRSPTVLAGAVVDEKGKPVANAVVEAFLNSRLERQSSSRSFSGPSGWLTTTTDAKGAFRFNNIPQQAEAGFRITAPGRAAALSYTASGDQWSSRFRGGDKDIRLVLPPVAKIAGRVLDKANGRPIPGLAFRVTKSGKPFVCFTAVSDADGKFELEGVEAGEYWLYQLPPEEKTRPKIVTTVKFLAKASETTRLELKAVTGGIVRVLVRDAKTKRPIPGALAPLNALKSSKDKYATAEYCDANGVALLCAPAGEYGVQPPNASRFGYPFHRRYVVDMPISREGRKTKVVSGKTVQVVMDMISAPRFTGVVRDPEGRTVAGAEIEIGPDSGGIFGGIFRTDSEGKYSVQKVGGQQSFLFARDPERNLVAVVEITEDTIEKNLILKPGLIATGRIVDAEGAPIPVASVNLHLHLRENRNRVLRMRVYTDSDGKFEIPAVPRPAGRLRYFVTVEVVGYAGIPLRDPNTLGASRLTAPEAGAAEISGETLPFGEIVLSPEDTSQSIAGVVVDQQGKPVAGARIFAGGKSAKTDANGKFVITGLGKGPIRVQASVSSKRNQNGTVSASTLGIVMANGGDKNVRIVIGKLK